MKYFYEDGKIVLKGRLYEEAAYHVSNEQLSAVFDGKGATVSYALANEKDYISSCYLVLFYNGVPVDIYAEKRVRMQGRVQDVWIDLGAGTLCIRPFLLPMSCKAKIKTVFWRSVSIQSAATESGNFRFAANIPVEYVSENKMFYFSARPNSPVKTVLSFYGQVDSACRKSSQPYYYHNGANWPDLSAMYAYAKRKYGMEYRYALESWFDYNVARGNYTPVEFFAPPHKDGSLLQAWSSAAAFVMDEDLSLHFWDE